MRTPLRLILDHCDDCQVCNTVYVAMKSNRERASFRNNPQTRPSSADRAGSRGSPAGTPSEERMALGGTRKVVLSRPERMGRGPGGCTPLIVLEITCAGENAT